MNQSILTGKMGVRAQQARLDTIGHNLSNVNTYGYKNMRMDFKDALYQTLRRPVQPQEEMNLELGHGVLVGQTKRDLHAGPPQYTGVPTDLYLTEDGFFHLSGPQGEDVYTREGGFSISREEDGQYLIMGEGWYVLDDDNQRVRIEGNPTDWKIDTDGNVSAAVPDANGELNDVVYAKLGLYTFADQGGLVAVGGNFFVPSESSGEPVAVGEDFQVKQGYIEMSNTELASEMTRMIRTQRALQLNSRSITTADQMMGLANTIRR